MGTFVAKTRNRRSSQLLCGTPGPALVLILGIVLFIVTVQLPGRDRRPMTREDFYAIKSVSDVSTSADGRWAVYVVQEID